MNNNKAINDFRLSTFLGYITIIFTEVEMASGNID